MNHIENIRADTLRDFDEKTFQKGDSETHISPSKQYLINATNFWSKEIDWSLTKIQIINQITKEEIFNFFVNDDQYFLGWVSTNNIDYLLCAEDIYGGQTVIDLTNKKIH